MTRRRDALDMAGLMGAAVEAGAAAQALGLALLRAEMDALVQMMPGQGSEMAPETATDAAARQAETDAAVEAGFDNLPV